MELRRKGVIGATLTHQLAAEAGASALFETNLIERALRDVQASARHIAMSSANYIVSGRLAIGLDAGVSRF